MESPRVPPAAPPPVAAESLAETFGSAQANGRENAPGAHATRPKGTNASSPLADCMRAAYRAADVDAVLSDCEEKHVGRAWRAKVAQDPDGGATAFRLEPPLIQASVRAQFDRFRRCYEAGLRRDDRLQGRVAVRFTIDPSGHVAEARQDDTTDMPDRQVVDCLVREFALLRFPKPEGGTVTVVYPIIFRPDDSPPPSARAQ
jgi:TonB family protein